jgi:nucleotide-binding universal stress UspA family protein
LLAYDGSEGAARAVEALADLCREEDVVTVLGVSEGVPVLGHAGGLHSAEQDEERLRQAQEAVAALAARGIRAAALTRHGDPAAAIVEEAEARGVDLVVVGCRGLGTTQRWLVGSVGTRVVQHAPCSVLVVR